MFLPAADSFTATHIATTASKRASRHASDKLAAMFATTIDQNSFYKKALEQLT
jgi:hypothetical protein